MLLLIVGLAVFLGAHLFTRARDARARLIGRIGEGGYRILYSALSAFGLVLIVFGWRAAPFVEIWSPPSWARHVTELLVLPAFILVASAYLPGRIRAKAKHPMLAGLKLWATAHLIANGDLASIILFGSFLAYGVIARIALKRAGPGEGSAPSLGTPQAKYDVIAVVVGLVAYLVFGLLLHPVLIGVPAFGR